MFLLLATCRLMGAPPVRRSLCARRNGNMRAIKNPRARGDFHCVGGHGLHPWPLAYLQFYIECTAHGKYLRSLNGAACHGMPFELRLRDRV